MTTAASTCESFSPVILFLNPLEFVLQHINPHFRSIYISRITGKENIYTNGATGTTPNRGTETYTEILKRHSHQKLNPNLSESPQRKKRLEGRNLKRNKEPPRQDRSWGYQRYPQQSENYQQQTRGMRQLQWRNVLDGRQAARIR